jgi:hypothetical protein
MAGKVPKKIWELLDEALGGDNRALGKTLTLKPGGAKIN